MISSVVTRNALSRMGRAGEQTSERHGMPTTPILMIPGLNATALVFQAQLDTLWQFGPVTIADHRRGGTMREIAEAILLDAPPRFVLGGFSMGGYIAFEIMREAPERVMALALIDTSARPDSAEASEKRVAAIETVQAGKFRLAAANSFAAAVHPSNVDNPDLKAVHLAMAEANGPDVYVQHQQAIMTRPDSRPDLADIAVPTMVIVGEADQITPPEGAREMAEGIPGAELRTIAGAGHLALLEQPDEVSATLRTWLAALT